MKTYGNLWDAFLEWDNLFRAADKARRGKRGREVVARFEFRREIELVRLRQELGDGAYRPGPFATHWITRPKPRLISAAPYRDRVVHHALMNVLEPILDLHFHPDSYACRTGKGTHAAARRLRALMRRNRYFAACDAVKFFPSIDHELLKDLFRTRVRDRRLLAVMDAVVDGSNVQEAVCDWFPGDGLFTPVERRRGLPIGNLTSQWFANWYLDGLDHLLTCRCRVGGFVRYCDDFIILDDCRHRLATAVAVARLWLAGRRLRLHDGRSAATPVRDGRTFVGYRVRRAGLTLPKPAVRAFRRRTLDQTSVAGWRGHAAQARAGRLLLRIGLDCGPHRFPAVA